MNRYQENWITTFGGIVIATGNKANLHITKSPTAVCGSNNSVNTAKNIIHKNMVLSSDAVNNVNLDNLLPEQTINTILVCNSNSIPQHERVNIDVTLALSNVSDIDVIHITSDDDIEVIVDSSLVGKSTFSQDFSLLTNGVIYHASLDNALDKEVVVCTDIDFVSEVEDLEIIEKDGRTHLQFPLKDIDDHPFKGYIFDENTVITIDSEVTIGEIGASEGMSNLLLNVLTGSEL